MNSSGRAAGPAEHSGPLVPFWGRKVQSFNFVLGLEPKVEHPAESSNFFGLEMERDCTISRPEQFERALSYEL